MTRPIRWGILSTANIGRAFARGVGLSRSSCIQAVGSRAWTRASEWAREQGVPRAFGSYEELLTCSEVDAIYNPLPNSLHAEWTIRALEAGKPVLCEKPFAVNAAEARQIVAASKRTGQLVAEAFMYRFHPVYDRVLGLIEEGAIGKVVSIYSAFTFLLSNRANIRTSAELAGGALMDVGCYCVNLSRRIAGCEPAGVHAFERRSTIDDTMMGILEFPNGILAQFECSIENHGHSRAEITGTDGAIIMRSPWFPGEEEAQLTLRQRGKEQIVTTPGANTYQLEADDFAAALTKQAPLRWGPEDAVANMAVIDGLYASARAAASADTDR